MAETISWWRRGSRRQAWQRGGSESTTTPAQLDAADAERFRAFCASPMGRAVLDVVAERRRQFEAEGFDASHDAAHVDGEIALAAVCYALPEWQRTRVLALTPLYVLKPLVDRLWPWSPACWKPSGLRRDLVKAGALILAEIERLDRAAACAAATELQP